MNSTTELVNLMNQLMAITGSAVGAKLKLELDKLLNTQNINIEELQAKIEVLQSILDADPDTPEFDQAQNIITQINAALTRLAAAEAKINTLNGGADVVGSVSNKVAAEAARATAAEDALATRLDAEEAKSATLETATADNTTAIGENADAITALQNRATTDEAAIAENAQGISDLGDEVDSLVESANEHFAGIDSEIATIEQNVGLNEDGTLTPVTAEDDTDGTYEYIHDNSSEGVDRANTVENQIKRLAKKSKEADVALDSRLDVLEGDETVAGSVAAKVAAETARAEEAEAGLAEVIAEEVERAQTAEEALQEQIDEITGESGDSGTSLSTLSTELDNTQRGAGLEGDGSYIADETTNYISSAETLKDADKILDAKVKELENAKAEVANVILRSEVGEIVAANIGQVFIDAMNCAFNGGENCDQVAGDDTENTGDGAVL